MKNTGPKTISEKIMSVKSGTDAHAGDIVDAEVDYVMVNDITGPLAFREFENLECSIMREKVVLIPDHYVPNKDVASAEQAKEMRTSPRNGAYRTITRSVGAGSATR